MALVLLTGGDIGGHKCCSEMASLLCETGDDDCNDHSSRSFSDSKDIFVLSPETQMVSLSRNAGFSSFQATEALGPRGDLCSVALTE